MTSIKGRVAIVGYAETMIGRHPDKTSKELALEVARMAILNAGISKEEIDGVITTHSFGDPEYTSDSNLGVISTELGLYPKFHTHLFAGGATTCVGIKMLASMIYAGQLNTGLIIAADTWGSAPVEQMIDFMASTNHPEWEIPYGFYMNGALALMKQRYMHETGTSQEQLASVCVSNRKWAALKPNAMFRKPLSIDDVLRSKVVCEPIHAFESNILADGAAALVITSAERARDLTDTPVYVLGTGGQFTSSYKCQTADITTFGLREAGKAAYNMAGIKAKDVDIAELYDAFSIIPLISLEDLGFCKRGEAGKFVQEGHTWPGADLPMTTNGGMLSQGHAGVAGGMLLHVEAVQQLMGKAEPERQVKGAKIALVSGSCGIWNDGQVVIYGKEVS